MEVLFTPEQLTALSRQSWWVACNVTPFLIKATAFGSSILLVITDLRTCWGVKEEEKKLMREKQIYAKTLQVSGPAQFLSLLTGILTDSQQKAVYKFIKKTTGDLTFQIQKQLEVYRLMWKFSLIQLESDIVSMICKDIINPLARTLNAQQKRIEIMRKKIKLIEDNLMKRMTETEKTHYKSALNQDQQDLKLLVAIPKDEQFITDIRLAPRSKFFFELALEGAHAVKNNASEKGQQKQKIAKVQKRVGYHNNLNADEIINELEMKRQQEKKKKRKKSIDFV